VGDTDIEFSDPQKPKTFVVFWVMALRSIAGDVQPTIVSLLH
jgi:hypothetical protein